MTTTRKAPTACIDCGRTLRSSNRNRSNPDMCEACFEYSGWENQHNDDGHDELGPIQGCPVCQGDKPTAPAPRTGHTNTAPKTHTSHAGHDHPATPKARAACRKAAAKG